MTLLQPRTVLVALVPIVIAWGVVRAQPPALQKPKPPPPKAQALPNEPEQVMMGVGFHMCDGTLRNHIWEAPHSIKVVKVFSWIGTSGGEAGNKLAPVDVQTTVFGPRGLVLAWFALDHYKEFTGPHAQTDEFVYPVTVSAGQFINVQHVCHPVSTIPASSQTGVIVWYVRP